MLQSIYCLHWNAIAAKPHPTSACCFHSQTDFTQFTMDFHYMTKIRQILLERFGLGDAEQINQHHQLPDPSPDEDGKKNAVN